jgi:hypothetical protein
MIEHVAKMNRSAIIAVLQSPANAVVDRAYGISGLG